MRKFLLAMFSVLLFVCLGAAIACTGGDDSANYYTLVFRQTNGVSYKCDVKSGWEVMEGTTVNFKLVLDNGAIGEPVVYANKNELTANSDNSYSVVITEDTVVRVDGLMAQGRDYNKLVFEKTPGVTFNGLEKELADGTKIKLENGMMVKMNELISFSLVINPKYQGTPVVYANDTELLADVNGIYSLEMRAPTTIRVEGLIKHIDLTYQSGDTRVRYYTGDEDNKNYILSDSAEDKIEGDVIEFKVQASVYYKQTGYTVLANTTILSPEADGYYRVTLSDDTTIKVNGLELEAAFTQRKNGGSGSIIDPFRLSRPIDLYQMALLINGGFYDDGRYYTGYYSLEADIDLEGEQLFIIGDGSTGISVFSGTFYGNGHTISNYYMNDLWIDQEEFNSTYITNVGLFGYVVPTTATIPAIYELNLDNFTITVDASAYPDYDEEADYTLYVGAFAGVAYGLDMIGCSATNGLIDVIAGDYGAYIGGLIGQQVSAYSSEIDIQAYTGVTSSYSDVDVLISTSGENAFAYAAGGITGFLAVGEEHLSAYILNSYSTGNVDGALNVGGIVGYAVAGTSVINCYSTGELTAYSHFDYNANWTGDYAFFKEFYYANAGGIAGRAGFNTVIYNCFSTSEIYAKSEVNVVYERKSAIAAHIEDGDELQDAHSFVSSIYGCPDTIVTEITDSFIRNTMKWDAEDWKIENGMPVINFDSSDKDFTIKFVAVDKGNYGDFGNINDLDVSIRENSNITGYLTMSMWNTVANGIPEFMDGKNGLRSYAYFFDAALTKRVFYSFIPTGDITLYVGYADYTEVAGTYYLGESVSVNSILEIEADGTYTYRNGGLIHQSTYTWDGENLVLLYGYLGDLADLDPQYRDYYLSSLYVFGATLDSGKLFITGGYAQEVEYKWGIAGYDSDGNPVEGWVLEAVNNSFYMFSEKSPLVGILEIEGFEYGSYYDNGTVYKFNGNGTGLRTEGDDTVTPFTYTVNGTSLSIKYDGQEQAVAGTIVNGYIATIGSSSVNPYDGFTGIWERPFAMNESYTFDGKASNGATGEWTYSGYDETVPASGYYTIANGVLSDKEGLFTAKINEDGFLVIDDGSASDVYYMGGSFAGSWYYSYSFGGYSSLTVTVNLTLNGISNKGYGTAKAEYGTGEVYELNYHAVPEKDTYTIYIYSNEYLYASMSYDAENIILTGILDSVEGSRLVAYDSFRGLWVSNNENLPTVQFNGNGFNDLDAELDADGAGSLAVRATAFVNGNSAGRYSINRSTLVGTYTYKNVTYTLKYNEALDIIEASGSDSSQFTLEHRDMWYGRQLEDENGFIYTFEDGRGNLTGGGTLTASNAQTGEKRTYTYYINSDDSIKLEAKAGASYESGTISVKNVSGKSVFMFVTASSEVPLTRHTGFTGEWIIGGESGLLNIGKIYADNTASGSYQFYGENKVNVEFTYNFKDNYLTFDYNGTTIYINALVSSKATELSIGPDNDISGVNNSICISSDRKDEYYGKTYYVYDTKNELDTGSTLVFDGLSSSLFGSGTAVMYDSEGNVTGAYPYSIKVGSVQLIYNYWAYYMTEQMLKPARELTPYELFCVHDGEGNYFIMARPDSLANLTVPEAGSANVTYTFNGVGGVVRHNANGTEETYSYVIILTDNILFKHILQFTDKDGNIYTATLDKSSANSAEWTITRSLADKYFGLVVRDAASDEAYFLFDGAGRVVRLSDVDSVVNYKYGDGETVGNKTTFTFTDGSGVQYTAVLDCTSSNANEWTITLTKK